MLTSYYMKAMISLQSLCHIVACQLGVVMNLQFHRCMEMSAKYTARYWIDRGGFVLVSSTTEVELVM